MDLIFLADLRARYPRRASWPLWRPFLCAFRLRALLVAQGASPRAAATDDLRFTKHLVAMNAGNGWHYIFRLECKQSHALEILQAALLMDTTALA
jgi:hypothetical protein